MNIFADQNPDCWGAMDFVDEHMNPVVKTLIVDHTGMGNPPGGGGSKVYFVFKGDKRKAFLNKTSKLVIANSLRTTVGEELKGAYLKITAAMVRNRKASDKRPEIPKEVLGMMVIAAAYPKSKQQQHAHATEDTSGVDESNPPSDSSPEDDERAAIASES